MEKIVTNYNYFKDGFFLKDFQNQKKIPMLVNQDFIY